MRQVILIVLCLLAFHSPALAQPKAELKATHQEFVLDQGPGRVDQRTTPIRLGPFYLYLPEKWQYQHHRATKEDLTIDKVEAQGPSGETAGVVVTYYRDQNTPSDKKTSFVSTFGPRGRGAKSLPKFVESFGTVVGPANETTTAEGTVVSSMAAERSAPFGHRYRVAYLMGSPATGANVIAVFEGGGKVMEMQEGIEKIIGTHRFGWSLYPEQENVLVKGLERTDLLTLVRAANPDQVADAWGPEFASLPGLGAILVLVSNREREPSITVARRSVRLKLADGRVLSPLEPQEMIKWFDEVYGLATTKKASEVIFGHQSDDRKLSYEKGILSIPKGGARGTVLAFRFPRGIPSGEVSMEYVLELSSVEHIPVEQTVRLNVRP